MYNLPTNLMEIDMAQRTDIHRPSAIKPEDYEFVTVFAHDDDGYGRKDAMETWNNHRACHPTAQFSRHEHGGACMVCGNSNALTMGIFYHPGTNSYVRMGQDCAEKMEMGVSHAFRLARTAAEAARIAKAGKLKAQGVLSAAGLDAAYAIYASNEPGEYEETTIRDIVGKLVRYGSISPAQTNFVRNLLTRIETRAARKAEIAASNATKRHVGVVGTRTRLTLTIGFLKGFDSMYGTVYIHLMEDAEGNVVVYKGSCILGEKGQTITLDASIAEHGEREGQKQTIIKRPKVVA
jgi:hypothetical protein